MPARPEAPRSPAPPAAPGPGAAPRGGRAPAAPGASVGLLSTTHAEWTKLRTLTSTVWLLLATVGLTVAISAATLVGTDISRCPPEDVCVVDLPRTSLTGIWLGQAVVAVLGALAMTSEYGTRTITTTLAANPRRVTVLLSKAGVVTALVLGAGVLAVAGSLLAALAILPGNGFAAGSGYPSLSLSEEPALRAAAGTVLYLGLVGLLGLGIGAIVRDTAGAVTSVLGLLYMFPIVIGLVQDPDWSRWLNRLGPASGMAIQNTIGLEGQPIGPWNGLAVLAGWAAGALLLGTVLFKTRDA
jgi:ABC-2 type transport system permease protein